MADNPKKNAEGYNDPTPYEAEKHIRAQIRGKQARLAGSYFEAMISGSCDYYLDRGLAKIEKTPKPIALCERAILSSSRPGELVVDFFGGSGSTLIACENTGRTCAMIELEPKWCDVIVRRYIKTTGDNNVRCVRQGRELPREEIAAIFEPDEEGGEQE